MITIDRMPDHNHRIERSRSAEYAPYQPGPSKYILIGTIRLDRDWDTVVMVLLGPDFEAREVWEAGRSEIEAVLTAPGSKARNERGSMSVSKFKSIGVLRWQVA